MEPACGDVNINEKEHVWMGVESDRSRCGRSNSTLWCWWRKNVVLFSFGMASRVQAHQIGIVVRLHCRQLFARLCYPMIVIVDHLHCRRYLAALNVKVVWLHCRRSFAALRCAGNSLWSTNKKILPFITSNLWLSPPSIRFMNIQFPRLPWIQAHPIQKLST